MSGNLKGQVNITLDLDRTEYQADGEDVDDAVRDMLDNVSLSRYVVSMDTSGARLEADRLNLLIKANVTVYYRVTDAETPRGYSTQEWLDSLRNEGCILDLARRVGFDAREDFFDPYTDAIHIEVE